MSEAKVISCTQYMTTYDFSTKTFGHATMVIAPWNTPDFDGAIAEIAAARKRLETSEDTHE